jgi:hypothetical protein
MTNNLEKEVEKTNIIFKSFEDDPKTVNGGYDPSEAEDYDFNSRFRGKFVYSINDGILNFIAAGNRFSPNCFDHSQIRVLQKRLLNMSLPEEVDGGGFVSVHTDGGVIDFSGLSRGYHKSFTKEDIYPVAKYVYERTGGKIKKALVMPSNSTNSTILNSCEVEAIKDPALRFAVEIRRRGGEGEVDDRYIDAIKLRNLMDYMVIDLEKEFGGRK